MKNASAVALATVLVVASLSAATLADPPPQKVPGDLLAHPPKVPAIPTINEEVARKALQSPHLKLKNISILLVKGNGQSEGTKWQFSTTLTTLNKLKSVNKFFPAFAGNEIKLRISKYDEKGENSTYTQQCNYQILSKSGNLLKSGKVKCQNNFNMEGYGEYTLSEGVLVGIDPSKAELDVFPMLDPNNPGGGYQQITTTLYIQMSNSSMKTTRIKLSLKTP